MAENAHFTRTQQDIHPVALCRFYRAPRQDEV